MSLQEEIAAGFTRIAKRNRIARGRKESTQNRLQLRRITALKALIERCKPVLEEGQNKGGFRAGDFNLDYHCEITVTIGELRALDDAVKAAEAAL